MSVVKLIWKMLGSQKKKEEIPTVNSVYLTMTPGRRSKFLLTMWSSSVSVFSEEP